jgi:citrate lyase subunit beta/citryl-CoA lyase
LRSFLFVPGDSEKKLAKALSSGADALILDLEDSVAPAQLPFARGLVRELLQSRSDRSRLRLWVRVNGPTSGILLDDLIGIFAGSPDGLVLPKVSAPTEIQAVQHYLEALEAHEGLPRATTKLMVIATETPRAVLGLGQHYFQAGERLVGLTWGAEDLAAALGATGKTDSHGALTFTFQLARSMCLLTAASLSVQAIDGVYADFRDAAGLGREIENARRDGFTGKLAIHPDQVEPINTAFIPGKVEIEWAQRVVQAFAAAPEAGVRSLDGRMLDRPHLVQAQRILELMARGAI